MNQKEKAKRFAQLHVKGAPLLLYNAWDSRTQREQCDRWSPSQNPSSEPTAKSYGLRGD
jgi:2-methylisocitrate lyase-like PEP mutase family enzyme